MLSWSHSIYMVSEVRLRVSQTCLGANVLSGLVPSTVFKKNLWAFLGPCVREGGAPGTVPLHNVRVTPHVLHQEVPLGCTEYVSFESFLGILSGPGEGRGGAPGTVPLQNPEVTSRKACLRNADRLSLSAQKSASCRASALGFGALFSPPPPPSAGYSVPPVGVAILVQRPLVARPIEVPVLQQWKDLGRVLVVTIPFADTSIVATIVYGFPPSHHMRPANETMLTHVFDWVTGLKCPAIVAGDLNATSTDSSILALLAAKGLWRLKGDDTTTRSKTGPLSNHSAIDHMIVNAAFLDFHPTTLVNYEVWLSDHYPLVCKWLAPIEPETIHWRWPKPMPNKTLTRRIPWPLEPSPTYVHWAEKAVQSLAASTDSLPSSKTSLSTTTSSLLLLLLLLLLLFLPPFKITLTLYLCEPRSGAS